MRGQLQFDEVKSIQKVKDPNGKAAREKWYAGFQKWCDDMNEDESIPLGKCGCGEVCEWCVIEGHGRFCVKAFIEMIKVHKSIIQDYQKSINYAEFDYEDAWNGNVNGVRLTPMNVG